MPSEDQQQPPPDSTLAPSSTPALVSLHILAAVKEAQDAHGLRHGDYARYRQYCSRKLRRTRAALHISSPPRPKSKEYTPAVDLSIPEKNETDRHLSIHLFMAERSWAHAMELKRELDSAPRKKHHLIRRLKKAAAAAQTLALVCSERSRFDERTGMETQAYACWMTAVHHFERKEWKLSSENFHKSKKLFDFLGLDPRSTAEDRHLLHARLDEIEPMLRFCEFNLRRLLASEKSQQNVTEAQSLLQLRSEAGRTPGLDLLLSKIEDALKEQVKYQAEALSELSIRGRKVPVADRRLRELLLTAIQGSTSISAGQASPPSEKDELLNQDERQKESEQNALFDRVIAMWDDSVKHAKEVYRQELEASKKIASSISDSSVANARALFVYARHGALRVAIQRNTHLATLVMSQVMSSSHASASEKDSLRKKTVEGVRLQDVILQNVQEMHKLDEPNPFSFTANQLQAIHKSRRCVFLALSRPNLALIPSSTTSPEAERALEEALALAQQASLHLNTFLTAWTPESTRDVDEIERNDLDATAKRVRSEVAVLRARLRLGMGASSALHQAKKWDELPLPKLHDFQSHLEPLIPKPHLYDLVEPHIEIPNLASRRASSASAAKAASSSIKSQQQQQQQQPQQQQQQQQQGGGGWLGRLWGLGGSGK